MSNSTIRGWIGHITETYLSRRISPNDAAMMGRHMDGTEPRDLIAMPNYRMLVRLMVDGERTRAFTAWGMKTG